MVQLAQTKSRDIAANVWIDTVAITATMISTSAPPICHVLMAQRVSNRAECLLSQAVSTCAHAAMALLATTVLKKLTSVLLNRAETVAIVQMPPQVIHADALLDTRVTIVKSILIRAHVPLMTVTIMLNALLVTLVSMNVCASLAIRCILTTPAWTTMNVARLLVRTTASVLHL